jgi:hypothetical protein
VISLRVNGRPELSTKVTVEPGGRVQLVAAEAGRYEAEFASGRKWQADVRGIPGPIVVSGPWELRFPAGSGAPERVQLDRLISWTEHPHPGIKFFSGTAVYSRRVEIPPAFIGQSNRIWIDMGRVEALAELKVNGRKAGTLWKPPFRVDITDLITAGENLFEVELVNVWPNRLIGDEQLPEDCQWRPGDYGTSGLVQWPEWLLKGERSPTGRRTFATWKHFSKNSPLYPSGLLGPVTVNVEKVVPVE